MVAWAQTQITGQRWRVGRVAEPYPFPALTGITGDLIFSAANVPPGIVVDFTASTFYGVPEEAAEGSFTITAADDNNAAELEVIYEIYGRESPIQVAAVPDLTFRIGQSVSYIFPQPEGGSGIYRTAIEGRAQAPYDRAEVYRHSLPDGLTYNEATRTLSGTVADSRANKADNAISSVTLRNAQVWAGGTQTGHNPALGSVLQGSSFNYPPITGTDYTWTAIYTSNGKMHIATTPNLIGPDSGTGLVIPNNPSLFVLRPADNRVLLWLPFALASHLNTGSADLRWPVGDFIFESGEEYFIEIGTAPYSIYRFRASDGSTEPSGLHPVRVPFSILLTSEPAGAPSAPTEDRRTIGVTTAAVTLSAADLPGVDKIVAGAIPSGFPVVLSRLRNYAYTNDFGNEVFIGGLDPATDYDLYFYYEDTSDRRSAPLVVPIRTEPARSPIPPQPVRGLTAVPGDNRLRLTWDDLPPFQNITKLEHRINSGIWSDVPHSGGATTGYVVPGLRNGIPATVEVRVVNPDGVSPVAAVTGTPTDRDVPPAPFRLPIQSRVLVDFDGIYLALENRVLSAEGETGRQAGSFDPAPGWAEVTLLASDGFIRLIAPAAGHQGFYSAEDLRNRKCLIQELYEGPTGRTIPVTRFGGWIEAAPMESSGNEQVVRLSVTDRLGQYARHIVRLETPLPAEYADERTGRILAAAGRTDEVTVPPNKVWCSYRSASVTQPVEAPLLSLLADVANSTGGRLIVEENQTEQGLPSVGKLRLEPAAPTAPPSVTLSDDIAGDLARNPTWFPIAELGNQPTAVLDPTNIYNTVELLTADGEKVIAADGDSVAVWGGRNFPVRSVIVGRDEAEALARHALRVYSNPRLLAEEVVCYLHFQDPEVGVKVAGLTLRDTVRLSYLPAGSSERIDAVQQVDRIRWKHLPGDKQYCQVVLEIGMLSPDATAFWIASHPGSNRLGTETWLAPNSEDLLSSGGYAFRYDEDDLNSAFVTADRYGLLTGQAWPVYSSSAERDAYETEPADGTACIVAGDNGPSADPRYFYRLSVYSSADTQWLTRASLSAADANPAADTLTWDTDRYDDGKTWAA